MTPLELDHYVRRFWPDYRDVGSTFLADLERVIAPTSRVLDIGCGRQTFGSYLYARAAERIGTDLDPYAQENKSMDAVHITDGVTLPFADASFDVVTAQWVLEHVAEPQAFTREVSRVLKPGGVLLFMTPNARSPFVVATRAVPLIVKKKLRSWFLGHKDDETFGTHYKMNSRGALDRLLAQYRLIPQSFVLLDCLGYFRFSKILVRLAMCFYATLNRLSPNYKHHIAAVYRKQG